MNSERNEPWIRRIHRGRLTAQEAAAIRREATHPADTEWIEEELALDEALGRLPRLEPSSNFTSQVLQSIERDQRAALRRRPGVLAWLHRLGWRPQAAVIIAAAGLTLAITWQVRSFKRQQLAEDLVRVVNAAEAPRAANLPGMETLQDFDAIQLATPRPKVDYVGLVAALNEP